MPTTCCVKKCLSRSGGKALSPDKLHFYGFPSDNVRKQMWIKAINRENFIPNRYSKVCSRHFTRNDFYEGKGFSKKLLRETSVPSIFVIDSSTCRAKRSLQFGDHTYIKNEPFSPEPLKDTLDNNVIYESMLSANSTVQTTPLDLSICRSILDQKLTSPKCSNKMFRSSINLPNPSAIRNWLSNVNVSTGFLSDVLEEIGKFELENKYCCLILDSMSIKKEVCWDKVNKRFVGYCDYGNNVTIEDCEKEASEVLVFMLSSIKKTWKWPIGYWFINKVKSSVQAQLIKIAITECQKYAINIMNVTCDGAYSNFSSFEILGCSLNQPFSQIKPDFNINSNTPNVWFTPDACHNIKLARNALGTFKAIKDRDGNLIEWRYIEQLYKLQNEIGFKLANKLTLAHINWRGNSMKVKLAAQTLSSSVADALEYL